MFIIINLQKQIPWHALLAFAIVLGFLFLFAPKLRYSKKKRVQMLNKKKLKASHDAQTRYQYTMEKGTNQLTEEDVRELIIGLGLPKTVIELFDGTCKNETINKLNLSDAFSAPYFMFDLLRYQQDVYEVDRYIPILVKWNSSVYAYDLVKKGFIHYYIETDIDKNQPALTWEGIWLNEIQTLWEEKWIDNDNVYYTDDDIITAGELLGLTHMREIIDSINEVDEQNDNTGFVGNDSEEWQNRMIKRLNARIA